MFGIVNTLKPYLLVFTASACGLIIEYAKLCDRITVKQRRTQRSTNRRLYVPVDNILAPLYWGSR